MLAVLLGIAVFMSAFCIDFCNTRYVLAVNKLAPHQAAAWSVCQWTASVVGFLVAIKFSFWMLPIEAVGLYAGAWYSLRRSRREGTLAP